MKTSNIFWFMTGAMLALLFDMAADPYRQLKKWEKLHASQSH